MSPHHIHLPIIYVPRPKPKKVENRRKRIQARSADTAEEIADVEEAATPPGSGGSSAPGNTPPPAQLSPVEAYDDKLRSPAGRLSEGTLKEMLQTQELTGIDREKNR